MTSATSPKGIAKERQFHLAILAIGLLFLSLPASAETPSSECRELYRQLSSVSAHNECRAIADCAELDLPAPLGCNFPLSKSAVSGARDIAAKYAATCGGGNFNCFRAPVALSCDHGHCVRAVPDSRFQRGPAGVYHGLGRSGF